MELKPEEKLKIFLKISDASSEGQMLRNSSYDFFFPPRFSSNQGGGTSHVMQRLRAENQMFSLRRHFPAACAASSPGKSKEWGSTNDKNNAKG